MIGLFMSGLFRVDSAREAASVRECPENPPAGSGLNKFLTSKIKKVWEISQSSLSSASSFLSSVRGLIYRDSLSHSPELVLAEIKNLKSADKDALYTYYRALPKKCWQNIEIATAAMALHEDVARRYCLNRDLMKTFLQRNPEKFFEAHPALQEDKEMALIVVNQNGLMLKSLSYFFRNDKDIVLAAVKQNGLALGDASLFLRKDYEINRAAVSNDLESLTYCRNRQCVLEVVSQDGMALENVDSSFTEDREIVLAAVRQNGLALEHADSSFTEDREIVLAAVRQNGLALGECSYNGLRRDYELNQAAVSNCLEALQFCHNRQCVLETVSNNGLGKLIGIVVCCTRVIGIVAYRTGAIGIVACCARVTRIVVRNIPTTAYAK